MTAKQYLKALEPVINKAVRGFDGVLPQTQQSLLANLLQIFAKLQTDVAGNILPTPENMRLLIDGINAAVSKTFSSPTYVSALREYIAAFDEAAKINENYFSAALDAFNSFDPRFVAQKQASIVQVTQRFAGGPAQSRIAEALSTVLQTSVTSGGSYEQLTDVLRAAVTGANGEMGILEKHIKTAAHDAIMEFNRSYTASVAGAYNLVFYLYDGGRQQTSRDFCLKREGKYFHKKEIESWASQNWAGKNPATTSTTIFTYCGGYNCNHRLIPVDAAVVPDEFVARAKSKGYINETEYQQIISRKNNLS